VKKRNEKAYYWPAWFYQSLPKSLQIKVPQKLINKLQRANLYFWRALNIYDDFLDEKNKPKNLPIANSYFRRGLEIYYRLKIPNGFYSLFNKSWTKLDRANLQEINQRKIKISDNKIQYPMVWPKFINLQSLSDKSVILGLGALVILVWNGDKMSNLRVKGALNFFGYVLAAKQISDDARDWLSDLKNGLITPANLPILKKAKQENIILDIKKELTMINLLFATESSPYLLKSISFLAHQARRELIKIGCSTKNPLIENLIMPLENAVKEVKTFANLITRKG